MVVTLLKLRSCGENACTDQRENSIDAGLGVVGATFNPGDNVINRASTHVAMLLELQ